jgi:hypothetical protein
VREAETVNVHDALEEKQLVAEFLRDLLQSVLSGARFSVPRVWLLACVMRCAL